MRVFSGADHPPKRKCSPTVETSPFLWTSSGKSPMLRRSVPKSKYMISAFTETFCVRPNSYPPPIVQPALVLESPCEGHPSSRRTTVGRESVLHTNWVRSCTIAAPPFTYGKNRSQYAYPTRAVTVDSQSTLTSQLKKKPVGQGRAP